MKLEKPGFRKANFNANHINDLNNEHKNHKNCINQQAKCLGGNLHFKKVFVLVCRSAELTLKPLGSSL